MSDRRDDMLERLLVDAGVGPGMRVVDLGCGRGDVTLLLARLVGPVGQVVGVDRDGAALAHARGRVADLGLTHVELIEADAGAVDLEPGRFDAVVGRRVLMYVPAPAAALRHLARALRPGGLMAFQEQDATMVPRSVAPLPLHERVHGWVWRTVEREGADLHMGFHLAATLEAAGLRVEQVRAEAVVQTPHTHHPMAQIVRAMLPRIVAHGVATAAELDVDTLEQRLVDERTAANATYVGDMIFGAWARTPA